MLECFSFFFRFESGRARTLRDSCAPQKILGNLGLDGPAGRAINASLPGGLIMFFEPSAKVKELQKRLSAFMDEHIYLNEKTFLEQIHTGDRWQPTAIV